MLTFGSVLLTLVGWLGAAATVTAYALVTRRRVEPDSVAFHGLNLGGASALCVSATVSAAWPSAMVNVVWMVIGAQAVIAAKHHVVRARIRAQARKQAQMLRRARQADLQRRARQAERLRVARAQGEMKRRRMRHRAAVAPAGETELRPVARVEAPSVLAAAPSLLR